MFGLREGQFPARRGAGAGIHTKLSPAVQRMSATAASMVSFAEAARLLDEIAGLTVEAKQVERTAERLGREVAEREKMDVPALPVRPTAYLGMDGTGIPVRKSETAGRLGKQPGGAVRTREMKLVLVWTAEARDKEGHPTRDPHSVTYSRAIESAASPDLDPEPSAFARRVRRAADRRGFRSAPRQVVLGDGAAWIWNLAGEHFPDAIQVVDQFHAKERLWDLAKELFAGERAEARCEELSAGSFRAMLNAIDTHANHCGAAIQCHGYFRAQRERMRYPEWRAAGLCVGSGVVEAGCKTAAAVRLKRAGMHWMVRGANAILSLRCSILSSRFEDFWAERAVAATGPFAGQSAAPDGGRTGSGPGAGGNSGHARKG